LKPATISSGSASRTVKLGRLEGRDLGFAAPPRRLDGVSDGRAWAVGLRLGDVHLDLDADAADAFGRLGVEVDMDHLAGSLTAGDGEAHPVRDLAERLCERLDASVRRTHVVEVLGVAQRRGEVELVQAGAAAHRELGAEHVVAGDLDRAVCWQCADEARRVLAAGQREPAQRL
jgi:hypothetical protein